MEMRMKMRIKEKEKEKDGYVTKVHVCRERER